MKILFVGGGSGGHVTPLRAVITALAEKTDLQAVVVTDRIFFDQAQHIFRELPEVRLLRIFSGKYRRYASKSFWWHLVHIPTLLLNIRDVLLLCVGCLQSLIILIVQRPKVVFAKGGFVSLPIGIAARVLKIPLIIHDSDAHPGLTSRVLSRWATVIATGMPEELYPYSSDIVVHTGIPVDDRFKPATSRQATELKKQLGFDPKRQLLLITGGGTGALRLNECSSEQAKELIEAGWQIVHFTGIGKGRGVEQKRSQLPAKDQQYWHIHEFGDLLQYTLAADVVLSRAGASALQEFANSQKPVIVVPSPHLSGGHQIKNAELFADKGSVIYIQEEHLCDGSRRLVKELEYLTKQSGRLSKQLALRFHKTFARPEAAKDIASLITETVNGGSAN